jgi:predicted metalloprotease with PDZ domain
MPRTAVLLAFLIAAIHAAAQTPSVRLDVDATHATERLVHTHERLAVQPGPLTLSYPQWYPGEHAPTGRVGNVGGLFVHANGNTIVWRRDLTDAYAFHVTVPAGVHELEIEFDYLLPEGVASARVMLLRWDQLLLYKTGTPVSAIPFSAHLKLPAGWQFASALRGKQSADGITFENASLETLVDSPLLAGQYLRKLPLVTVSGQQHELDVAAEDEADLPGADYAALVSEAIVQADHIFGPGHFRDYHFLVHASRYTSGGGIEHHESSDDQLSPDFFHNPDPQRSAAYLLPHEYAHSWNGKFRRPADLYTSNYQQPMRTDLLWVYEGGTDFLGNLLAARSGMWSHEEAMDFLATHAADLTHITGREWRPLQDTTDDAWHTMLDVLDGQSVWPSYLRRIDYYEEGNFVWLEADAIILQQTQGKRSLDDFFRSFYGGPAGKAQVKTYVAKDVFDALNAVAPYNWKGFFEDRLQSTRAEAPLGGLERTGWKLVYSDRPNAFEPPPHDARSLGMNTIGFAATGQGEIVDIVKDGLASKAGFFVGMRVDTLNGSKWSAAVFRTALAAKQPLHFTGTFAGVTKDINVPYAEGLRYPHLERVPEKEDLLTGILKPR